MIPALRRHVTTVLAVGVAIVVFIDVLVVLDRRVVAGAPVVVARAVPPGPRVVYAPVLSSQGRNLLAAGRRTVADGAARGNELLSLRVSVVPACVARGQTGAVRIRTLPDTRISLMVVWPDGDPRGAWYFGGVDPKGNFTLPFVVGPEVPEGDAEVWVAGANLRVNKANYKVLSLKVAGLGICR